MRYSLLDLGELRLYSLELESTTQEINYYTSLYIADTLTKLLLKMMIEYIQLKIGAVESFFSL